MPTLAMPNGYAPFVVRERFTRIEAGEETGFAGFWAEVRMNLTNGERKALIDDLDEIAARRVEMFGRYADEIADEKDAAANAVAANDPAALARAQARIAEVGRRIDATAALLDRERYPLICSHVRAWNVYRPADDGDGDHVAVPPPAEAGIAALDEVTPDMAAWLVETVISAYRSGKGLSAWSPTPGGLPGLGSGPGGAKPAGSGPTIPASPTKSRSRSKSTFAA